MQSFTKAGHTLGPLHTISWCAFPSGVFPLFQGPHTNLTAPTNTPPGAAPCPPNLGTCNSHLCAELSLFLPKTRCSVYPWNNWQQHSGLLQKSHYFTAVISTRRLYSLKVSKYTGGIKEGTEVSQVEPQRALSSLWKLRQAVEKELMLPPITGI